MSRPQHAELHVVATCIVPAFHSMRWPGPGRLGPARGAAVQNRDAPSRAWNTEPIGGGARDGRMTGDHSGIGGRGAGTGTQISPDGACAAAGAASCARQILPSSSPPRRQLASQRSSCYLIPPAGSTLADITPPCCAAQSSSALHPLSASSPHPHLNFPAVQFPPITSSLLSQG